MRIRFATLGGQLAHKPRISSEEAIAIWDELFEVARELGPNPRVVLNYSALAYRELYDLDEARSRSEQVVELSGGMSFGMPMQFARSDLLFTQLLAGDVGARRQFGRRCGKAPLMPPAGQRG